MTATTLVVTPGLNDMQAWRGSVEARPFVMALRDYYVERAAENPGSLTRSDGWALQYINMGRVPSIREAFDDDSSGFVTVNEANHFTQSRPLNWRCAFPGCTRFIYLSVSQPSLLDSVLGHR